MNKLIINISWNSKDWKEESQDKSNHEWVKNGGIPFESWNFANDAEGNTDEHIFGYAKFTNNPKISGKSIFIFYSDKKIVGFYGNGTIVEKKIKENILNLRGVQNISFVLKNKIENIVEKGYLEDGKRIGQGGFNYLHKNETVVKILDEALQLNPNQEEEILRLKEWFMKETQLKQNKNSTSYSSISPLNQILYGPPGTGKTYKTILEAAKIVTGNETITYDEALRVFNDNLNNQIEFITFHQNYSYEDFIQGLRPDITQNNHLSFERTDGVFMQIAVNALFEFYKAFQSRDNIFKLKNIDVNEVYIDFFKSLKLKQEFKTKTKKTIYIDSFTKNQNIIFKYSEASKPATISSERLLKLFNVFKSVEEINNINEDIRNVIGGCDATVYYTSLREFIDFYNKYRENLKEIGYVEDDYAEEDYVELNYDDVSYERKKELLSKISFNDLKSIDKEDVKNYVIIIDEINRANISRVFGELITLIEEDKRSHGKIPMRVTLPSGDSFIVPSNLYIIGTMNTADKSISLLDIALRRRFEFIPMYPNSLIEGINSPTVLETINAEIIKRKGHDFTIGHAYFMGEEYSLEKTINNKVIPLLLEYFMNDGKEVATILKAAEIEVIGWPMQMKTA